eukprot:TRINITY_DN1126_c0_g6_i2.p1 TRINITY_DN1126_c0_g6~~TRINITY_DN1126_c0_g6_i2.p1  ORF type:complete len:1027 (+),score=216.60 TRINITY_DN1126_c0_g6_i2:1390-4470(+)
MDAEHEWACELNRGSTQLVDLLPKVRMHILELRTKCAASPSLSSALSSATGGGVQDLLTSGSSASGAGGEDSDRWSRLSTHVRQLNAATETYLAQLEKGWPSESEHEAYTKMLLELEDLIVQFTCDEECHLEISGQVQLSLDDLDGKIGHVFQQIVRGDSQRLRSFKTDTYPVVPRTQYRAALEKVVDHFKDVMRSTSSDIAHQVRTRLVDAVREQNQLMWDIDTVIAEMNTDPHIQVWKQIRHSATVWKFVDEHRPSHHAAMKELLQLYSNSDPNQSTHTLDKTHALAVHHEGTKSSWWPRGWDQQLRSFREANFCAICETFKLCAVSLASAESAIETIIATGFDAVVANTIAMSQGRMSERDKHELVRESGMSGFVSQWYSTLKGAICTRPPEDFLEDLNCRVMQLYVQDEDGCWGWRPESQNSEVPKLFAWVAKWKVRVQKTRDSLQEADQQPHNHRRKVQDLVDTFFQTMKDEYLDNPAMRDALDLVDFPFRSKRGHAELERIMDALDELNKLNKAMLFNGVNCSGTDCHRSMTRGIDQYNQGLFSNLGWVEGSHEYMQTKFALRGIQRTMRARYEEFRDTQWQQRLKFVSAADFDSGLVPQALVEVLAQLQIRLTDTLHDVVNKDYIEYTDLVFDMEEVLEWVWTEIRPALQSINFLESKEEAEALMIKENSDPLKLKEIKALVEFRDLVDTDLKGRARNQQGWSASGRFLLEQVLGDLNQEVHAEHLFDAYVVFRKMCKAVRHYLMAMQQGNKWMCSSFGSDWLAGAEMKKTAFYAQAAQLQRPLSKPSFEEFKIKLGVIPNMHGTSIVDLQGSFIREYAKAAQEFQELELEIFMLTALFQIKAHASYQLLSEIGEVIIDGHDPSELWQQFRDKVQECSMLFHLQCRSLLTVSPGVLLDTAAWFRDRYKLVQPLGGVPADSGLGESDLDQHGAAEVLITLQEAGQEMQKRTARVDGSNNQLQAFRDNFDGELKPVYEEQIRWLEFSAKEVHTLVTQDLIWSHWEKYGPPTLRDDSHLKGS